MPVSPVRGLDTARRDSERLQLRIVYTWVAGVTGNGFLKYGISPQSITFLLNKPSLEVLAGPRLLRYTHVGLKLYHTMTRHVFALLLRFLA